MSKGALKVETARLLCVVRYKIDLTQRAAFARYAELWEAIVPDHGGEHHGFFLTTELAQQPAISFGGLGREAAPDEAYALFSFPDETAYHAYRASVPSDPRCAEATALVEASGCILSYERGFQLAINPPAG